MSNYVSKLIAVANAEIGYLEKKNNSQLDDKTANAGSGNYTKYARDLDAIPGFYNTKKQGAAWCDVWVDAIFVYAFGVEEAKKLLCQPSKSLGAGCYYSALYYRNKKQFHANDPKPGDQIFFWNNKKNGVAHTGIVVDVDDIYVHTIEGNTSGASGVIANGGGVKKKKYPLNYQYIYGYGRPAFDAEPVVEDKPVEEKPAETIPVETKPVTKTLTVDGLWGTATTTRLQEIFKTTKDGVVSNQYMSYKARNPGLVNGWEWERVPGKNGSALIKAMQAWAGIPAKQRDGFIGPNTIRAFQKKLGTVQDGRVSKPSSMVKALQRWANNQP